jgi:hypothetical protein
MEKVQILHVKKNCAKVAANHKLTQFNNGFAVRKCLRRISNMGNRLY